jgi:two-component system sensor histidine kinase DevS
MLLTRQQLEERLVALHRASLELVKDVSLETLLERIAAVALEQVDARYAALGVLGPDGQLKSFIHVGLKAEQVQRIGHRPLGLGLLRSVMRADAPIRVPEIQDHPDSVGFPRHHPKMHSFLGVPIRVGEELLGQIYLTDKISAPEFTADDEGLIEMLATYAAVAIQNASLYEQLRTRDRALTRRNDDLALLNETAGVLTSSLDLDDILNKTLALVLGYLKVEAGEIFLLDDDNKTLRLVIHRGPAAEAFWIRSHFQVGEGLVGLTAKKNEPVISTDLQKDDRLLRDAVVRAGFRTLICLPLVSSGNVVGVLTACSRRTDPFEEHDVQLLVAVCGWAGLSIENARLHHNARRLAVLEERERIGMDLHDGIIQSIYGVGLVLEQARLMAHEEPLQAQARIADAIRDLNLTIRDIRTYILDLRPRQLGDENLMDGLKRLVAEYRANTNGKVLLTGKPEEVANLPPAQALALFHICQEALANATKHAQTQRVDVSVWATDERVMLEVRDGGLGFEVAKKRMTIGHGLANMQTRARQASGDVEVTSAPGEGTSVLAWVPRLPTAARVDSGENNVARGSVR